MLPDLINDWLICLMLRDLAGPLPRASTPSSSSLRPIRPTSSPRYPTAPRWARSLCRGHTSRARFTAVSSSPLPSTAQARAQSRGRPADTSRDRWAILVTVPISQCQQPSTPIERQLLDGVRFLDVRLRVVGDELLSERISHIDPSHFCPVSLVLLLVLLLAHQLISFLPSSVSRCSQTAPCCSLVT